VEKYMRRRDLGYRIKGVDKDPTPKILQEKRV